MTRASKHAYRGTALSNLGGVRRAALRIDQKSTAKFGGMCLLAWPTVETRSPVRATDQHRLGLQRARLVERCRQRRKIDRLIVGLNGPGLLEKRRRASPGERAFRCRRVRAPVTRAARTSGGATLFGDCRVWRRSRASAFQQTELSGAPTVPGRAGESSAPSNTPA